MGGPLVPPWDFSSRPQCGAPVWSAAPAHRDNGSLAALHGTSLCCPRGGGGLPEPGAAPCGPRLPGGAAVSPDTLFSSPLLLQDSSPGALPMPPSLAGVLAGIVTDFHVTVCVGLPYLEGSAGCTVGGLGLDGGMCVCLSPAGAPGHSVRMPWRCQTLDPWVHRSGRWEMGGPSPGSTSWTRPISDGMAGESPIPGSAAHGGAVPARPPGVSP